MPSVVGICNLALTKLGADSITALTEDSKAARTCNSLWDATRKAVLRYHPWNCAMGRARLELLDETPAFEYAFAYALPSDNLRVLQMEYPYQKFKIEGKKLLTNEPEAKILYIRDETDPEQYDALLVDALATRMADEMSYAITGSFTAAEGFARRAGDRAADARSCDAQEGTPVEMESGSDDWINARL